MFNKLFIKFKRKLATKIAATGTIVIDASGSSRETSMIALSFLQKSLCILFNAGGLTFHVSPDMY